MNRLLILVLLTCSLSAAARQEETSLSSRTKKAGTKIDSIDSKVNNKVDAVQSKINAAMSGDLSALFARKHKTDSVITSDSLRHSKEKLDSLKGELGHKVDSLKALHMPTDRLNHLVDSLNHAGPFREIGKTEERIASLEKKLNEPLNKVQSTVNDKLALMNKEGGAGTNLPESMNVKGIETPGLNVDQPGLNLPGDKLNVDNPLNEVKDPLKEQLGPMKEAQDKVADLKNIPEEQLGKMKNVEEVKDIQQNIGKANELTDKAQAYQSDARNLAQGNVGEVKELPKTIENKVASLDEVQGLQKEMGQFDQYSKMAGQANNPEALKQEAIKQATTMAVDHFAGQQEALKAAMDKMSKLKSKYSQLSSLKDIPKRKPNEMKGKPLIERLVPALTLQIQKSQDVLLDYNALVGYRFFGRFTAGAGWNERVNIGKHVNFSLHDRVYGPRVFADFKIKKGFSVRTDIEKMNTYIPALTGNPTDGGRAWVWSAFVGIKKDYRFTKSVRGNFQILYNLYDDHYNSPYGDRLVTRIGFEFPMKKKPKPSASQN